jgi:hypothetical protein
VLLVTKAAADKIVWLDLEDGVQIQFSDGGEYLKGDYWLIPARVATGGDEWAQTNRLNPGQLPPQGVEHHNALLGFVRPGPEWKVDKFRHEFSSVMKRGSKNNAALFFALVFWYFRWRRGRTNLLCG